MSNAGDGGGVGGGLEIGGGVIRGERMLHWESSESIRSAEVNGDGDRRVICGVGGGVNGVSREYDCILLSGNIGDLRVFDVNYRKLMVASKRCRLIDQKRFDDVGPLESRP